MKLTTTRYDEGIASCEVVRFTDLYRYYALALDVSEVQEHCLMLRERAL
jgi:hypothetical protein